MFLSDTGDKKRHVDPENLVLSLTRLRDFLEEKDVKELSLPVYDRIENDCILENCTRSYM